MLLLHSPDMLCLMPSVRYRAITRVDLLAWDDCGTYYEGLKRLSTIYLIGTLYWVAGFKLGLLCTDSKATKDEEGTVSP